jgi:hypothetical protein
MPAQRTGLAPPPDMFDPAILTPFLSGDSSNPTTSAYTMAGSTIDLNAVRANPSVFILTGTNSSFTGFDFSDPKAFGIDEIRFSTHIISWSVY